MVAVHHTKTSMTYAWLGAGVLTLGVGAGLASGAGVAHADGTATNTGTSSAHGATHARTTGSLQKATASKTGAGNRRSRNGTASPSTAVQTRNSTPPTTVQSANTGRDRTRTTAAAPQLSRVADASARVTPLTRLLAPLMSSLVNLFGMNTPTAPSNPLGGLLWGVFRSLNNALGLTPHATTPTVGTPDSETGTVIGTWGFTVPAGLSMTYGFTQATDGVVHVYTDGTYSYTPTHEARLAATATTTDSFTITADNGIASTRLTVSVPVLPSISGAPVALAATVGIPDPSTGTVTGTWGFTDPAGRPLTYRFTGTASGDVHVYTDGAFSYTPTVQARQAATATTTDTFTITADNGIASTTQTVTVPVSHLGSNTVVATITVGTGARAVAASPDGTRAYVVDGNTNGNGAVSVIDTATNTVIATVNVGFSPQSVVVSPDSHYVYVTDYTGGGTVKVIDTTTNTISRTITVGTNTYPGSIAVSPDGSHLYVVEQNYSSTTAVIDTATGTVTAAITATGSTPDSVAMSPDGTRLYIANSRAPGDLSPGTVSVVDTGINAIVGTINIGNFTAPEDVVVSPNGRYLYVLGSGNGVAGDLSKSLVSVVSTATNTVIAAIPVSFTPGGLAISPDGATIYVSSMFANTVAVISTATNAITDTVAVGQAGAIAITPNGNYAYVVGQGTMSVYAISI